MRGLIEGTFFLGLATAAHLVAWAPTPDAGIQAAGDGGDALLTLAAASASVAQMVEDWETPPDVPSPNMAQPTLTATDISSPDMAGPKPPVPALAAPAPAPRMAALALPRNDAMPRVMTAPASPPPAAPEPVAPPQPTEPQIVRTPGDTEPRPTARPKQPPKPRDVAKATKPEPKTKTKSKPKAKLNSASSASKRAAGTGARGAKGDNGANAEATLSKSARASLMSKWGSQIRATIARNVPRGTGKGTAVVHITLSGSGQLIATKLQKSSGNPAIDQAALRAVKNAGRFPPAPAALGSGRRSFAVPIRAR